MEHSEQMNELATALSKAQSTLQVAKKGSENPFFKSKYADLYSVWAACREALTTNGLAVSQVADVDAEGRAVLETVLMHTSGQWLKGRLPLMAVKPDPQAQGSAITYARRYSLSAIVGLCTEEDDDGEAAMSHDTSERICPIHHVPFKKFTKGDRSWWSHLHDGTWCNADKPLAEPTTSKIDMDWLKESLESLQWADVGKWLGEKYPEAKGQSVKQLVVTLTPEHQEEFVAEVQRRLEVH